MAFELTRNKSLLAGNGGIRYELFSPKLPVYRVKTFYGEDVVLGFA